MSDEALETVPLLEAVATTRLPSHVIERPSLPEDLGRSVTCNELHSGITPSPTLVFGNSAIVGDTSNNTSLGSSSMTPIISEPRCPPSDSDDDNLALNSSSLSLVSDDSVDDDALFNDSSHGPVSGLGISGLRRKDGSGPFDGLGIVSIKSSAWRHGSRLTLELGDHDDDIDLSNSTQGLNLRHSPFFSSSAYDDASESEFDLDQSLAFDTGDKLSDVFLRETLLTFTEDPFHTLCHSDIVSLCSIPDCGDNDANDNSWLELGLDGTISTSTSTSGLLVNTTAAAASKSSTNDSRPDSSMMYRCRRRLAKLNTNFSSATISSELKRSSTAIMPKSTWRNRSSSWPFSTATQKSAATPLSRSKWRL